MRANRNKGSGFPAHASTILKTRQTKIMGIGAAVRLRTKCKKVAHGIDPVNNITQVSCLKVFGVTLQSNHRSNEHIKVN